jgi:predicted exporter
VSAGANGLAKNPNARVAEVSERKQTLQSKNLGINPMTPAQLIIEIEAAMNRVIEAQSDRVAEAIRSGTNRNVIIASSRMLALLEMKDAINEVLANLQPNEQTTTTSV